MAYIKNSLKNPENSNAMYLLLACFILALFTFLFAKLWRRERVKERIFSFIQQFAESLFVNLTTKTMNK